ncbi:MAG: V-type ATP synthase subunit I [Oscillospiraceae bacterium]|nr:V-type ATP synthase subunit I [Oscillospiraceae bacterium]
MAVRSERDELLRELLRHGCVEISEPRELQDEAFASLVRRESGNVTACRSDYQALQAALTVLGRYVPAKSPLLAPKPEVSGERLLQDEAFAHALEVAGKLRELSDRIRRIGAEESRCRSQIEALTPWRKLDLPLETEGTKTSAVTLGSMPLRSDPQKADELLAAGADEAELFPISEDRSQRYLLLLSSRDQTAAAVEALRPLGFAPLSFSGLSGTAEENVLGAEKRLKELAAEKDECELAIGALAGERDALKLASDAAETRVSLAETREKLCATDSVLLLQGWVPAEREEELARVFERFGCAWETEDPPEEDYPEVPVLLKNNKFTNSLNMVTNMYSLPAYGTVDPNPLMAPFFILFFGLMMADMGYGLIMIAAALVAFAKMKPDGGSRVFCQLLLYGGVATFAMGVLTGAFFSDVPYQVVHILNPQSTWPGLWHLFSPETDSTLVLYGSMVLGLLHLNTGMAVSFAQKWKAGNKGDALFEEGSLWVILVGALLLALDMLLLHSGALQTVGLVILILGAAALLFGAGRHAKGFGKVTAAFGCIYNTATGWFGDVLSYSRIMALMLAGGVVGKVFNTVAVMPAQSNGVNAVTVIAFLIIFVLGHTMNFALNLLGCYVHDLRLQCLEFFGKFYTDGGKPFRPLGYSQTYVKAK